MHKILSGMWQDRSCRCSVTVFSAFVAVHFRVVHRFSSSWNHFTCSENLPPTVPRQRHQTDHDRKRRWTDLDSERVPGARYPSTARVPSSLGMSQPMATLSHHRWIWTRFEFIHSLYRSEGNGFNAQRDRCCVQVALRIHLQCIHRYAARSPAATPEECINRHLTWRYCSGLYTSLRFWDL